MFGWGYKSEALKWRKHVAKEDCRKRDEIENTTYDLVFKVTFNTGESITTSRTFRGSINYYPSGWSGHSAEDKAACFYENLVDNAMPRGITLSGTTYLPHTIASIKRLDNK